MTNPISAVEAPAGTETFRLPQCFRDDYISRFDGSPEAPAPVGGTLIRQTKKHYYVALTSEQRADLKADAEHYAEAGTYDMQGLVASARATVAALA